MVVIVEAVPIVMQVPAERAMPASMSFHCCSVMLPASFSAQYFQTSEPEPRMLPPKWPRIIGPAGMKIDGQVHRNGTHDGRGRRLVAAAHQHGAINGMLAQQFLGLHGEEVAVEHAALA